MRRTHVLIAVVTIICLTAVGLRARSYLAWRSSVPPTCDTTAVSLPMTEPPDYVTHPWVEPGEADRGPARIVSLAPSITEVVAALGMADRLVGRTQYCLHPAGIVETVPAVGALMDTNYARIVALKPELILAMSHSRDILDQLERLDLRCESVPHETLDEIFGAIERIGDLCERPKTARALIMAIRYDLDALSGHARATATVPRRVLVTTGDLPVLPASLWVSGPGSFLDALLVMAGHVNAVEDTGGSFVEIPLNRLLTLDPDVILEFRDPAAEPDMGDLYRAWSGIGPLRAIRNQAVRSLGSPEGLSAGPRVARTLHRLVTVMSEFSAEP